MIKATFSEHNQFMSVQSATAMSNKAFWCS